ncbi:GDSL family lipase [Rhodococcus erythropolis]|nr:GDSL family lipase [Rhodococcus erythropolis]
MSRTGLKASVATVVAGSSAGTLSWLGYNYLMSQAGAARGVIGRNIAKPPEADGVYAPGADNPELWWRAVPFDLHLMIFGDSSAAGVGALTASEVPGVQVAKLLASETGKRIRLSTKAIGGATSRGLSGQVDAMFVAGPPPDAAVILIGANDVTAKNAIHASAKRLGDAVRRLRECGASLLSAPARIWGWSRLSRNHCAPWCVNGVIVSRSTQASATRNAGGHPVPLADLLAKEFLASPDTMFSADRFHPSAAGYELAAKQIVPVLASALGEWQGGPLPELPHVSEAAQARTVAARLTAAATQWKAFARRTKPAVQRPDVN